MIQQSQTGKQQPRTGNGAWAAQVAVVVTPHKVDKWDRGLVVVSDVRST
jgi:hypothetical protein